MKAQRGRFLLTVSTLALIATASVLLGWLLHDLRPPPPPVTGVELIRALYALDGEVLCTRWRPIGQTCAGGCYWRRTCYTESGSYTQTSCRPQAGAYCPLSTPGTPYGPEDTALNAWATGAWGGSWNAGAVDWVRAGQTLQDWVGAGGE